MGEHGRIRMFDVMVLQSFIMQHMTVSIQVNHVSKYKYSPWKNNLNIFLLGCTMMIYALSFYYKEQWSSSRMQIQGMLLITVIAQWHYILNVVHEMSTALEIRIFCTKDKRQAYIAKDKIFSDSIDDVGDNKEPHYELPDLHDTDNLDETENADGV